MALSPSAENEEEENSQFSHNVPEQNLRLHLLAVMDLFLLYNKCFPHVLDIPSSVNFLADIEQMLGNEDCEAVAVIQERVLQLLITLDSFAFTPDKVNIIYIFIIISLSKTILSDGHLYLNRGNISRSLCVCVRVCACIHPFLHMCQGNCMD
jgi:hypothetical protein